MASTRETWRSLSRVSKLIALGGLVLVVALAGSAIALAVMSQNPDTAAAPTGDSGDTVPLPPAPSPTTASPTSAASAAPTPSPTPVGADPLLGTDGRLTVLLLGSDYRPAHPGNRTDAIMVVSVDPTTGKSAGFSIPRDTVNFPLPGGRVYGDKVNALYQQLLSTTKDGNAAMKNAVAKAFNIEVDSYVFIGFDGVKRLVGAVGGVDVTLDKAYYDPDYWVTARKRGWGLPSGTSHLGANDALIFARSRKGDNDFGRARRQQILILAALKKVRERGPGVLPALLSIAGRSVRTDLPLDRAQELFRLFSTVDLSRVDAVVFGPRSYATGVAGTSFALKLAVCRVWINRHFPPVRPLGSWPAPSAASPSPPAP